MDIKRTSLLSWLQKCTLFASAMLCTCKKLKKTAKKVVFPVNGYVMQLVLNGSLIRIVSISFCPHFSTNLILLSGATMCFSSVSLRRRMSSPWGVASTNMTDTVFSSELKNLLFPATFVAKPPVSSTILTFVLARKSFSVPLTICPLAHYLLGFYCRQLHSISRKLLSLYLRCVRYFRCGNFYIPRLETWDPGGYPFLHVLQLHVLPAALLYLCPWLTHCILLSTWELMTASSISNRGLAMMLSIQNYERAFEIKRNFGLLWHFEFLLSKLSQSWELRLIKIWSGPTPQHRPHPEKYDPD